MKRELNIKDQISDFLKTVGNETFIIRILTWVIASLFLSLLILSGAIIIQSQKLTNIKPLVIYVDRDTGITSSKDYEVVDARNESRNEKEIWIFVNEFIRNLYDYTRFSQLRNLENAYQLCSPGVQKKVKQCFIRDGRPGRVKSDVTGLCDTDSVFIMDTLPDLRVRVIFTKKVLGPGGALILEKKIEAVMRIKTITRSRLNPYGLYITDYRETIITEKGER